ncbi:MAG: (Fe-S)-binding protein [Candidatus Aenigmatarchaeota archaeon]
MSWLDKLLGGNILYYPGCLTKFVAKDLKKNYEKILELCGIEFIELSDKEVCCGSPALNAGAEDTFKMLAKKNFKVFKEHAIKKIIFSCPACFKTFSQDYRELFGEEWKIECEYILITILRALKEGKIKIKRKFKERVTFHDPCYLARYSEIINEPREILKMLGFKIVEMEFYGKNTFCCGGGGGLQSNYQALANKIAEERINQAKKIKVKTIITSCPLCYLHLKRNSKGIKVMEISDIIISAIEEKK